MHARVHGVQVQMTWLGSLGYVPILEPWPLTPHRPRLEETLDEIRDDVENEIGSEDAATSDASVRTFLYQMLISLLLLLHVSNQDSDLSSFRT